jgi:hypothetical protein
MTFFELAVSQFEFAKVINFSSEIPTFGR